VASRNHVIFFEEQMLAPEVSTPPNLTSDQTAKAAPMRPGSRLGNTLILLHFEKFRWIYIGLSVIVFGLTLFMAELYSAWLFAVPPLLLLLFVLRLPQFPRLSLALRFLQYTCVLYLGISVLMQSILALLDIFDRFGNQREPAWLHAIGFSDNTAIERLLYWQTLLPAGCIAVLLIAFARKRDLRTRLAFFCLLVGVSCACVDIPSAMVRLGFNSGEFLAALGPSLVGAITALLLTAWALAVVSVLARKPVLDDVTPPANPDSPTNEYMKAASAAATTALVIAFFGVNTSIGYVRDLKDFIGVRQAYVADLIAAQINHSVVFKDGVVDRKRAYVKGGDGNLYLATEELSADYAAFNANRQKLSDIPKPLWLEDFAIVDIQDHGNTFLADYPRGIMFTATVKEIDQPQAWKSNPTLLLPEDLREVHTLRVGAICADRIDEKSTPEVIYRACEKQALNRGVKFPFIDTEFPVEYVVLVAFVSLIGSVAFLSDRIRAILDLPLPSAVEPWILLDAKTMFGKLVANGWVLALVVAPWLLVCAEAAITALRTRVVGSTTLWWQDSLMALLIVLASCLCCFISVHLIRDLITLRYTRRLHLTAKIER